MAEKPGASFHMVSHLPGDRSWGARTVRYNWLLVARSGTPHWESTFQVSASVILAIYYLIAQSTSNAQGQSHCGRGILGGVDFLRLMEEHVQRKGRFTEVLTATFIMPSSP